MPYTNFQLSQADLNFKLEVDFGSGFEDSTANLFDISISQEPFTDTIAGILTRKIEVRLEGLDPDIKWTKANLPVRVYIYANNFEELLFDGLTKGGNSISGDTTSLRIVDKTNRLLHSDFSGEALDLFTYEISGGGFVIEYLRDGAFLPEGDNEEGGTVSDTNYRPRPLLPSAGIDNRCNLLVNRDTEGKPGLYTCDQMLKAMGVFGGFNKDGVFKIKKRVWETPTSQWDLRNLQDSESFRDLYFLGEYSFNSIDVEGFKFKHSLNKLPFIEVNTLKKSQELVNFGVSDNSSETFFLDDQQFPNILIGEGKTKGSFTLSSGLADDSSGSLDSGVYITNRAYNSRLVFNGTDRWAIAPRISLAPDYYNFRLYGVGVTFMFWMRPFEDSKLSQVVVSNRDASDRGQSVRISKSERTIQLVNHGLENISSNTAAFDWGVWQAVAVTISSPLVGGIVKFYINGRYISQGVLDFNLGASEADLNIGKPGEAFSNIFRGSIQELRIYDRALNSEEIKATTYINLTEDEDLINSNRGTSSPGSGITAYFRMGEGGGSLLNNQSRFGNNATITSSDSPWSTSALNEELRRYTGESLNYLYSYSNNNFNQVFKFDVKNERGEEIFLKRLSLSGRGVYQRTENIKKNSNTIASGDFVNKREYASFYINDTDYAQDLADNFLSVYGNNDLPIYEFDVEIQPRLMVGDIVTFRVYAPNSTTQDCVGVILEKTTSITASPFKAIDTLKVKKLRNL